MTKTFDFGYGPVAAHQHKNGGGWVADTASVADSAYIGPNAQVFGNARVSGNARVFDDARVYDNARVFDDALVFDKAFVYDKALVYGNAQVYDKAHVYGNAVVYGSAHVSCYVDVYGDAIIKDDNWIKGVIRSDEYHFILAPCKDKQWRIIAGCRYFTFKEAEKHWNKKHPMYKETMDIIEYLRKRSKNIVI